MWGDLEWKLHAARRCHDEVRRAAVSRGGEVGAHMAAAGLGKVSAPSGTIVGNDNSKMVNMTQQKTSPFLAQGTPAS